MKRFIFDQESSRLFAPDGRFLKTIYCDKGVDGNHLITDDPLDKSRGCKECGERVLNIDRLSIDEVLAVFECPSPTSTTACVMASRVSDKVIFLRYETGYGEEREFIVG
jgi:hypothetical protein